MSKRGDLIAIGLLKQASKARAAGEALVHGTKALVGGAAEFGGGAAKALGAPEAVGKALGVGALGAGGYVGYRKGKRKLDELKFRLQYGDQFY